MRAAVRREGRRRFGAGLATALAVFAAAPARAQSEADRWASAIVEQKDAIASNRSAQARCFPAGDPRCAALAERGRLMASNLSRLERQHARLAGRPAPTASRAGVGDPATDGRGRLRAGGGMPPGVEARPVAPQPQRSFFSMLFGGGGTTEAPHSTVRIDGTPLEEAVGGGEADASGGDAPSSGHYRTLCVRTCDGYFFPVSFTASRSRLATDAKVCRALCPQAETRLFYHDASGQEAEDAVAADDGTRLGEMTNAFLYRRTRVAGCGCGTPDPRTLPVQAGGVDASFAGVEQNTVPLPRVRPAPDQDPETQAIRLSGLSADPVAPSTPITTETAAKIAAAAPKRIRIVGPKWLSDRGAGEAGASPARDPAP